METDFVYKRFLPDEINAVDNQGQTLLHRAIEREQEAVVQLLSNLPKSQIVWRVPYPGHKGNPRVDLDATIKDNCKRTPLYLSVATGNTRIVELVTKMTYNVDAPGPFNRTPLHLAVIKSMSEIVKFLVSQGASPLSRDKEGSTPIGVAAKIGSVIIVDILFKSSPAEELIASTSGTDSSSLLHLAAESDNIDTVVYLLSRLVDTRSRDLNGYTAAHIASRHGNVRTLRQLISTDRWLRDAINIDGFTLVHE
ncbi:serine/threonine-protein phosphatase 6 regulatory ankyrin repeat subunit B-like [Corticium candelabrum]|uniref:serine/threonine-protein phosphatase 6 regulatory ankyrin repeat subunit B-like n=1 Tax=Corticium candelabrum TaxID=121492 RepID=UPI002E26E626|nr:serine/threonine-protein phosphatase 6 regulatory ankyrin repeat subunit B-like [Corticium candelabrum]